MKKTTTLALIVLAVAVLAVVALEIGPKAPQALHQGQVFADEFEQNNLFFATSGEGKYCRPLDPSRQGDWWLEYVYQCNSQATTFSPTLGLQSRVLSPQEAMLYHSWRESQAEKEQPTHQSQDVCNSVLVPLTIGKEEKISAEARRVTFAPVNGCIMVKAYDTEGELLLPEYKNCSNVKSHFQVPGGAGYRIVRPDPDRPASGLCVKS